MTSPLARRALAEFLGTALLVAVVVGSGIMATNLSHDVGLQLLANSTATVFGLAVLILIFGPVSGAHFNPVVTLADYVLSRRSVGGIDVRAIAAYIPAQIAGGIGGSALANLMFNLSAVTASKHSRSSGHLWLGETVATVSPNHRCPEERVWVDAVAAGRANMRFAKIVPPIPPAICVGM